jgi:hypothetical protein
MVFMAAAALAFAGAAHAATVEHWWNITYATANPDGVSSSQQRSMASR